MLEYVMSLVLASLPVFIGTVVHYVKNYLLVKGGEKAVVVAGILARNAVTAVEQIARETDTKGEDKLVTALSMVSEELQKHHIHMTDDQIIMFLESAVHEMNGG